MFRFRLGDEIWLPRWITVRYMFHMYLTEHTCLEHTGYIHVTCLEGQLEGRRSRRRPRTTWTMNISEWTGLTYNEAVRKTETKTDSKQMGGHCLQPSPGGEHDDDDMFHCSRFTEQFRELVSSGADHQTPEGTDSLHQTADKGAGERIRHPQLPDPSQTVRDCRGLGSHRETGW